jgi:hypothetical protein
MLMGCAHRERFLADAVDVSRGRSEDAAAEDHDVGVEGLTKVGRGHAPAATASSITARRRGVAGIRGSRRRPPW